MHLSDTMPTGLHAGVAVVITCMSCPTAESSFVSTGKEFCRSPHLSVGVLRQIQKATVASGEKCREQHLALLLSESFFATLNAECRMAKPSEHRVVAQHLNFLPPRSTCVKTTISAETKGEVATMKTFIEYPNDHPFSIHNLPYGSFYTNQDASSRRCGVAIGDCILDLQALSYTTFYPGVLPRDTFAGVSGAQLINIVQTRH